MIFLHLRILPAPDKRRELLEILRSVSQPTAIQPGCMACEIFEGAWDDARVLFLEQWESSDALHLHLRSALFLKVLAAMELSIKQPTISFHETAHTWGIELVESARTTEGLTDKED